MIIKELKCSNCGSNDFNPQAENKYACKYCGTINIIQRNNPFDAIPRTPSPPVSDVDKKKLNKIVVIAAMVSLGFSGALAFLIGSDSSPIISENILPITPTTMIDGVEYLDTITVLNDNKEMLILWQDSFLTSGLFSELVLVGEVQNKSGAIMRNASVNYTFYKDEIKKGSLSANVNKSILKPDEKAYFCVKWHFYAPHDSVLRVVNLNTFGTFINKNSDLTFNTDDVSMEVNSSNYVRMKGVVQNNQDKKMSAEFLFEFFDEKGKFVGSSKSSIGVLSPKEKGEILSSIYFGDASSRSSSHVDVIRKPHSFKITQYVTVY